jgi:hypothetical protein
MRVEMKLIDKINHGVMVNLDGDLIRKDDLCQGRKTRLK